MKAIPFVDIKAQYQALKSEIDENIHRVLDHGKFILGPEVGELEAALAEFTGAAEVVGVASGTDALLIAMMAEGIGPGDAVFLPSFTFTATAEVVLLLGATPIFVDVEAATFNIDCADLAGRIDEVAKAGVLRPRIIVAVDLFGLPADYVQLTEIADRHNLLLLADAAQSIGAATDDRRVGALAPVTATSFFPAKPLGCYGDGGALFTDDPARAELYHSIRVHGKGDHKYDTVRVGLNGRLDTLQAAILLVKLRALPNEIQQRERVAGIYDSRLSNLVETPDRFPGKTSAWAQYSILVDDRDRVCDELKEAGVPTAIYYPKPMHLQTAYREYGHGEGSLPVCEALSHRIFSLPMHAYMTDETGHAICDEVAAIVSGR